MKLSTFWNCEDGKTSNTPQKQKAWLTYSPPQTLSDNKIAQERRNFHSTKDELSEEDVQAEATNIQTQSIIEYTGWKPGVRFEEKVRGFWVHFGGPEYILG